ncbi:acyl-CoA thioesterase [Croceitalea rosinachiae]|uniref:Thioesterase n=1 Tax=Croceitalea rosinachiae TaxID=3075596 RepID=A0ABU3ACP0_9FLAO|nr:acyl-ACP thioesterase domain-containing protein [Croceitalea sp. F388]MDT0607307.1 thioesterase [Croceitalea sp. F388]
MLPYSIKLTVTEKDLDDLRHVNNVRYLDWIQQISKEHWQYKADESLQKQFVWVVRKHSIIYHSAAKLNDQLLLETEIINSKGPISVRRVIIKDNKAAKLVVTSETDWCLINPVSMKPVRIPDSIKNLF